jgi:hypothetical protein
MRALLSLLVASFLALSLSSADAHSLRVECDQPRTLRLHRFEDGSARLECGSRLLVRISAPG